MQLEIAQRLRPFSHRPGTYAHLPGSTLRLRVFPTRVVVEDVSEAVPRERLVLDLALTGPIDEFTVQQDLEKGSVAIWGRAREGFYRLRLWALTDGLGITMAVEKLPLDCVVASSGWGECGITDGKIGAGTYVFSEGGFTGEGEIHQSSPVDRLSLGSHKGQNWEQICGREDFSEILPLWHRLGQLVGYGSSTKILAKCERVVDSGDAQDVLASFREVFLACFDGMMAPRLSDVNYNGIKLPMEDESPLTILSHGAQLIRSLFVQVLVDRVMLLPVMPPEFHAGRLLDVPCGDWGTLSFEWTKKAVRRVVLVVHKDTTVSLQGRKEQKACRLRLSSKDRGAQYVLGSEKSFVGGSTYWFDNFTK